MKYSELQEYYCMLSYILDEEWMCYDKHTAFQIGMPYVFINNRQNHKFYWWM
jgi:hypothetical protein